MCITLLLYIYVSSVKKLLPQGHKDMIYILFQMFERCANYINVMNLWSWCGFVCGVNWGHRFLCAPFPSDAVSSLSYVDI